MNLQIAQVRKDIIAFTAFKIKKYCGDTKEKHGQITAAEIPRKIVKAQEFVATESAGKILKDKVNH